MSTFVSHFVAGDRVWWLHTANHIRRGTVREMDTNTIAAVRADDDSSTIYINAAHLVHEHGFGGAL